MNHAIALIIPLLSLILQSYPRFFNKYFGVDVWTRMLEIEHVRKAHHKIPGKIKKGFLIEGMFDYPIIFPWLFSFVPKKILFKLQGFVSPVFDVLQNLLVYFVAFSLTQSIEIAFVAQILYASIPIMPVENSYLTPRSMGYFTFTLAFLPLLFFTINNNALLLFLGLFFTTCLFLIHRFAIQSLLLIFIFFTFVDMSLTYILVFFAGFILATSLTNGFYLRVLNGHLYNIYFWVKNYEYRFAHQIFGNAPHKKLDWVGKIYFLLSKFPFIFLFGLNIWGASAFIFLYLIFNNLNPLSNNIDIFYKFSLWIIFFYIFGTIVLLFKRLIPIGEGQRYLEMTSVPSAILSSYLIIQLKSVYGNFIYLLLILVVFVNLGIIIFFQIKGIIKDKNRSLTEDLINVYKYINKLKNTPRIICIPHQITTMTVYNTKADVLVNADNPGLMKITDFYPILKKSVKQLAIDYKLDYLLLNESFVAKKYLKIKINKVVYRSGEIILIKL